MIDTNGLLVKILLSHQTISIYSTFILDISEAKGLMSKHTVYACPMGKKITYFYKNV